MHKNLSVPLAMIAVAILVGCAASKNSSLAEAHSSYDNARNNPAVTNLAALELKQAGDSLNKADNALSEHESADTVNQLAYLAKQQVAIAQETAKRKTAELEVADASAQRDRMRLDARTAEADAAKQQVANMQGTADKQTAALAAANANADQQTAALAAASANADQQTAALAAAGANADQQAAALAAANASAEHDQALIAQQEKLLKDLNAKKTARGMVITLGDVLFSTNKSQLAAGGKRNVQKLADFLKQFKQHKAMIEGYTDSTGSSDYNQTLSLRRADAVRTALIDMEISGDRINTHGYGEEFPVASNKTAAGRQQNRRVEIILSDGDGNIAPR